MVEGGDAGEGVLSVLSELLRDRWTEPVKGLAALLGIVILCRLGNLLSGEKSVVQLAGSLACAGVLGTPLLELIEATGRVIESACVFLGASVPVYAGLMAASGSAASGSSYGLLALAAGSVIPLLSSALLLPLLRAFFMLALTSALCRRPAAARRLWVCQMGPGVCRHLVFRHFVRADRAQCTDGCRSQ